MLLARGLGLRLHDASRETGELCPPTNHWIETAEYYRAFVCFSLSLALVLNGVGDTSAECEIDGILCRVVPALSGSPIA